MSIAAHHTEWLSLIEVNGPFLSLPVLQRAFPQGLDAHDPDHVKELRIAFEEWEDECFKPACFNPAIHRAWVEYILAQTLGYPDEVLKQGQAIPESLKATMAEERETLRPDYVLVYPDGNGDAGKPRLLIQVYDPRQGLERPVPGKLWKAAPDTRMMELCHATQCPLGLATNGEQWMLVYAPVGETTGFATWNAQFLAYEEPITLRAFRSLLGAHRFFGVDDAHTLEALLQESSQDQQEVTDQLGLQVRKAVELLVYTLDRIDAERGRAPLEGISEAELYEAALTVMMRLVFLFSAEERGLLLLGDTLYNQYYAVSTLSAQLRETADRHGEEILERRFDAWCRLLATFRAVYGGVQHENLRLPAYGGHLFDPDRFAFLEGRAKDAHWRDAQAAPLPVDNRTVLHLMEALQFLQVKLPGMATPERRRLSFRALDIEQIGHVYEGLLDHTVFRVPEGEVVLGLVGTVSRAKKITKEPEVVVSDLEACHAKGEAELLKFLKAETGRSDKALRKALDRELDFDTEERLRRACGNDDAVFERIRPFVGLVRDDDFGRPVVILANSFYVTQGSQRRQTGTHYTPRSLTEPIVKHTLDPLVYDGPAEGEPEDQWQLKSPREILELKVCDMAMGSGAFLVQTCRYLSEKLAEAWEAREQELLESGEAETGAVATVIENVLARPASRRFVETLEAAEDVPVKADAQPARRIVRMTPEGEPSKGRPGETLIPLDTDERLIYAKRLICDRCLYGVDKNPLAVEMAKLSLWLITMEKGRAFTFLDHALKCGDSLLGLWDVEQVHKFHLDAAVPVQAGLWGDHVHGIFEHAMAKRRELEAFTVIDVRDAEAKARLLEEADQAMDVVRMLCDQLIAAAIATADGNRQRRGTTFPQAFEQHRNRIFDRLMEANSREEIQSAIEAVRALVPEGQALLNAGNPSPANPRAPFHWPIEFPEVILSGGFTSIVGNPPFMGGRRVRECLGNDYREALYALYPNSSGNADYSAFFFLRGFRNLSLNGTLGLIATNTIAQGDTRQTGLETVVAEGATIYNAAQNAPWPGGAAVHVSIVHLSKGPHAPPYLLDGKTADYISSSLDSRSTAHKPRVLADNSGMSHMGSNVVGTGFILSSTEAQSLFALDARNEEVIFPFLNGSDLNTRPDQSPSRYVINFFDWPLEEAETYSDCMKIVRDRVLPERVNKPGSYSRLWWQYGRRQERLYEAIQDLDRVLIVAQTSKTLAFTFVSKGIVYSHATIVFAFDGFDAFAVMQSNVHVAWVLETGSTLKGDARYIPTDCFETFPFAESLAGLESIGERYYAHRQSIMQARQEGLTKTYNRFHAPDEHTDDIQRLRELHVEMDRAVADAYDWTNLHLGHDFHDTKQGIRFTISEPARREVLDRLLALNHERYQQEVEMGLHDKGKKSSARTRSRLSRTQPDLPFEKGGAE